MLQCSRLALLTIFLLWPQRISPAADLEEAPSNAEETKLSSGEALSWDSLRPELTIGDQAPAIDVEHWVQDGQGRFPKVTELEPGKVYVLEFWATWCGPCVASMPHISQLQDEYADRGIQFVSISDEKLDTVNAFLQREVQVPQAEQVDESDTEQQADQQPQTYAEVTSNYCLTTDPDRSVLEDYFEAAGCRGIPTAMIVGKDGKVEWIGHPMAMDEVLEQVVTDSWDRAEFQERYLAQQRLQVASKVILEKAHSDDGQLAYDLLESLKSTAPDDVQSDLDSLASAIDQEVYRYVVEHDQAKAAQMLPQQIEAQEGSPRAVLQALGPVFYLVIQGKEISPDLSKAATTAAEKALEDDSSSVMEHNLRTLLARLYPTQGNYAAAIEQQEKLLEAAPESAKAQLQEYLEELRQMQSEQTLE